jgi:hypothetical protein
LGIPAPGRGFFPVLEVLAHGNNGANARLFRTCEHIGPVGIKGFIANMGVRIRQQQGRLSPTMFILVSKP